MEYRLDSPLGDLIISEQDGKITALRFAATGEKTGNEVLSETARRLMRWLARYFAGERPALDLPLAPEGTAFQERVWLAVCAIPYGQTISYGELASRIGCRSARAVGAALKKNPIWILIPCHRVVGKDGALTGYAGGLERKQALIDLEKQKDNKEAP